jgi:hypothetical protein
MPLDDLVSRNELLKLAEILRELTDILDQCRANETAEVRQALRKVNRRLGGLREDILNRMA